MGKPKTMSISDNIHKATYKDCC